MTQEHIALGIVAGTALFMLIRFVKSMKKPPGGCGSCTQCRPAVDPGAIDSTLKAKR